MANKTVYPYGPGGQLPSTIGIVDDLVTGGANQALSAQQGVVLKSLHDGLFEQTGRNYINGYYIKSNGGQEFDATKFRTCMIPAVQGDVIYWRYGSTGSMYMCEYNAEGVFLNAWVANSNTGRSITLTRETTAFIIASFNANYFNSAAISKNGVLVWRASDGNVGDIAALEKSMGAVFSGGTFAKPINVEWNGDGQYMSIDGELVSNANYQTSAPLFVPAGCKVSAELGCGTAGCAIAVVESDGTFIRNAVTGQGATTTLGPYEFTAEEDCYVMFSGRIDVHPYVTFIYDASSLSGNEGDEEIVYKGTLEGGGDTLKYARFPAQKGDYLRIRFPDGDWATNKNRDNYNKLILGYVRVNGVGYQEGREVLREGWSCPDYGFDFIVEPYNSVDPISEPFGGLSYRAVSNLKVPYVITRLSKTTPKSYFNDELAKTIRSVKDRIVDGQSLVFAICSDLHYCDIEEGYRPFAQFAPIQMAITMRAFTEKVRTDNVVCLGDVSDGRWTAARAKKDAYVCQWFLAQCKAPVLNVVGNHDDNRYYGQQEGDRQLTQAEIYSDMMAYNDERATVDGAMGGCNYYRDVERAKIRLITLMGINFSGAYAFTAETQDWLTTTFASMPEGWKAIIFTHVPPVADQNWSGSGYTGGTAIANIITANRDKVLFLYEGHTHIDNVYVDPWPAINIGCQKVYNSESGTNAVGSSAPEDAWWPIRAVGDYREVLWDAVVIDQTNALLSCIRFGAGVDRYVHLNPVTVAAGASVTLTPSVLTADTWHTKASEAGSIAVADGVVTLTSEAVSGSRLTVRAADADGNFEYWTILVE